MIHLDMYLSMIEQASKKRGYRFTLLGTHTFGFMGIFPIEFPCSAVNAQNV